jgi:hypothetical protein
MTEALGWSSRVEKVLENHQNVKAGVQTVSNQKKILSREPALMNSAHIYGYHH